MEIDRRAYPLAFSCILIGLAMGITRPVMPKLANGMNINSMQYGFVMSITSITRLVINIPAGLLTDTFGRKFTLVIASILLFCGYFLITATNTLGGLICCQFVSGVGMSLMMAGAHAYLSDISSTQNRAQTMAPLMIAFSAGMTVGPFIGGFLSDYYDSVRKPFVFATIAFGFTAVNNMYNLQETLTTKNTIHNTKHFTQIARNMWTDWLCLGKDVSHMSGIMVEAAVAFSGMGCMITLLPLFITNELGGTATQTGSILSMMSVVNIFGAQWSAKLSDKYGRKKVIVPAICIMSVVIAIIPQIGSVRGLYGLIFVYSIGSTLLGTSPMAYIADLHSGSQDKEQRRSQALAMMRLSGACGLMLGNGFLGYLTHVTDSFILPMCIAAVIFFAAAINFVFNAKETVKHRSE
eukprot:151304_1